MENKKDFSRWKRCSSDGKLIYFLSPYRCGSKKCALSWWLFREIRRMFDCSGQDKKLLNVGDFMWRADKSHDLDFGKLKIQPVVNYYGLLNRGRKVKPSQKKQRVSNTWKTERMKRNYVNIYIKDFEVSITSVLGV